MFNIEKFRRLIVEVSLRGMQLNIKIISKYLKRLIKFLENHLGFIVMAIFVIILLYAVYLFYNFVYKPVSTPFETSFEKIEIKKAVFDKATERIDLRAQNISEAMGKEYRDVFK